MGRLKTKYLKQNIPGIRQRNFLKWLNQTQLNREALMGNGTSIAAREHRTVQSEDANKNIILTSTDATCYKSGSKLWQLK